MTRTPRAIYKYDLTIADTISIKLPARAQMLHVGLQNGLVKLWALVQPDNPLTERTILVRGTGHDCSTINDMTIYMGTVITGSTGSLVLHFFEKVDDVHHAD